MDTLKEIGGTVIRNQNSEIWMLGQDGRIYRHTFHKNSMSGTHPEGTVVRIYYEEPGHNDVRVKAVEEWDSPSYFVESDSDEEPKPRKGKST